MSGTLIIDESRKGGKVLLTVTDKDTRTLLYGELFEAETYDPVEVLLDYFVETEFPDEVITDYAKSFTSENFVAFLRHYSIQHSFPAPFSAGRR